MWKWLLPSWEYFCLTHLKLSMFHRLFLAPYMNLQTIQYESRVDYITTWKLVLYSKLIYGCWMDYLRSPRGLCWDIEVAVELLRNECIELLGTEVYRSYKSVVDLRFTDLHGIRQLYSSENYTFPRLVFIFRIYQLCQNVQFLG